MVYLVSKDSYSSPINRVFNPFKLQFERVSNGSTTRALRNHINQITILSLVRAAFQKNKTIKRKCIYWTRKLK